MEFERGEETSLIHIFTLHKTREGTFRSHVHVQVSGDTRTKKAWFMDQEAWMKICGKLQTAFWFTSLNKN